jgi:hypothetical protein
MNLGLLSKGASQSFKHFRCSQYELRRLLQGAQPRVSGCGIFTRLFSRYLSEAYLTEWMQLRIGVLIGLGEASEKLLTFGLAEMCGRRTALGRRTQPQIIGGQGMKYIEERSILDISHSALSFTNCSPCDFLLLPYGFDYSNVLVKPFRQPRRCSPYPSCHVTSPPWLAGAPVNVMSCLAAR